MREPAAGADAKPPTPTPGRLSSLVCHVGQTPSSGHYVADRFDLDSKQWIRYNDSIVVSTIAPLPPLFYAHPAWVRPHPLPASVQIPLPGASGRVLEDERRQQECYMLFYLHSSLSGAEREVAKEALLSTMP